MSLSAGLRIQAQRCTRRSALATNESVAPSKTATMGAMTRGEGSNECQAPPMFLSDQRPAQISFSALAQD